jgi:hypothetical protein
MSSRVWSLIIGAIVVVALTAISAAERWTLVRHVLDGLKAQGPLGEALAGALISPVTPLVIALMIIVIALDLWRMERENARSKHDHPVASLPSKAYAHISGSGNPTANANIGDIHIHPPTVPPPLPPILPATVSEEYYPVNVGFEPSEGQFEKMYLRITNRSESQLFQAQCRVLARRNDPNPQHRVTYPLNWEVPIGRALRLLKGESGNLLIASVGEDRSSMMGWMKLESASTIPVPDSRWNLRPDEPLPEYDLEITVLGQQSKNPQTERFTVRPGKACALEMYHPSIAINSPANGAVVHKREYQVKGTTTIPRANVELRVLAAGRWHHNGYATVQGNSWQGTCWFGDKDTMEGEFLIRAIADGNLDKNIKYPHLPDSGCHSRDVKVLLKREVAQPTSQDSAVSTSL